VAGADPGAGWRMTDRLAEAEDWALLGPAAARAQDAGVPERRIEGEFGLLADEPEPVCALAVVACAARLHGLAEQRERGASPPLGRRFGE
jgi:hypothetical protein